MTRSKSGGRYIEIVPDAEMNGKDWEGAPDELEAVTKSLVGFIGLNFFLFLFGLCRSISYIDVHFIH